MGHRSLLGKILFILKNYLEDSRRQPKDKLQKTIQTTTERAGQFLYWARLEGSKLLTLRILSSFDAQVNTIDGTSPNKNEFPESEISLGQIVFRSLVFSLWVLIIFNVFWLRHLSRKIRRQCLCITLRLCQPWRSMTMAIVLGSFSQLSMKIWRHCLCNLRTNSWHLKKTDVIKLSIITS